MGSVATKAWVTKKRLRTKVEKRLNQITGTYREKIESLRNKPGRLSKYMLNRMVEEEWPQKKNELNINQK